MNEILTAKPSGDAAAKTPTIAYLTRLADAADSEPLWNPQAPDRPDLVVLTLSVWDEISDRLEDAQDAQHLAQGEPASYTFPIDVVQAMLDGVHPIRAWRKHKGFRAAADLAKAAGISGSYLLEIEKGAKPGSISAYAKIASALDLPIDALIDRDG